MFCKYLYDSNDAGYVVWPKLWSLKNIGQTRQFEESESLSITFIWKLQSYIAQRY